MRIKTYVEKEQRLVDIQSLEEDERQKWFIEKGALFFHTLGYKVKEQKSRNGQQNNHQNKEVDYK